MPVVEFVGQSGRDSDNVQANTSRLINLYREPTTGGKTVLKSVLGMTPHSGLDGVFIRAMGEFWGTHYAVCGGWVWEVTPDGSANPLFEVIDSVETTLSSNGQDVITVAAGGTYYVWDGSAATEPTGGAFDAVSSVEFLDHYTLLTEKDGRRFQWTDVADPETLDGLNFTTADGADDLIIRGMALSGHYWVFKQKSHEIWYNTGGPGADAFARVQGMVRNTGLAGFNLIAKLPDAAFMIGSDGRAHLIAGGIVKPVSTPPVETAIKDCRPVSVLTYEDEGHTFCAIILRDCPAWVFDVATGEWHERAEGATLRPWNVQCSAKVGATWFLGRNTGEISRLTRSNADGIEPLVREATSATLTLDGARFVTRELEFFPRQGVSSGSVWLSLSRDGGMTWTPNKTLPLGGVGGYGKRLIARNLGQSRMLTARLRWSAPADVTFSTEARVVV